VDNWEYSINLPEQHALSDRETVRGSQWRPPLFEFSGACAGCGETPYLKVLTQVIIPCALRPAAIAGSLELDGGTSGRASRPSNASQSS
jgi:pyruvate-ferredoxin/flavodoxin oxidoreductase